MFFPISNKRQNIFLLLLTIIFSGESLASPYKEQDPSKIYSLGLKYFDQKKHTAALDAFLYIVSNSNPNNKKEQASAAFALSWLYQNGIGITKDPEKHFQYLKLSAELGHVHGQHHLGHAYDNGVLIKKNSSQAAFWYEKAAINGDSSSMYHFAFATYRGIGVTKNKAAANEWFLKALPKLQKASTQGDIKSSLNLYKMYLHGYGVSPDLEAAFVGFSDLAAKNIPEAQYQLGWMYYLGKHTKQDLSIAHNLWSKAALKGHKGAQHFLKKQKW